MRARRYRRLPVLAFIYEERATADEMFRPVSHCGEYGWSCSGYTREASEGVERVQ